MKSQVLIIKDHRLLFRCSMEKFDTISQEIFHSVSREGATIGEFIEWVNCEEMGKEGGEGE